MLAAAALTLTGCAGTVAGEAVRAPDAAVVAQLDTGDYDTAPTRELGTAGDDAFARGLLESQRIAEFVVGPWEVDEELTRPAVGAGNGVNQSIPSADILQQVVGEAPGVVEAGRNRGLIAGFSSWRGAADAATGGSLLNAVLRFPDPAAAQAAAAEIAAALDAPGHGESPREPAPIPGHPDASAVSYTDFGGTSRVRSFTAHGPYVLYQLAAPGADSAAAARELIGDCLDQQVPLIDNFVPTPVDVLGQLPKDPSGELLPAVLTDQSNGGLPVSTGAWQPLAWLHFEPDPRSAREAFDDADVDVVAQRLATVYRTRDEGAAAALAEYLQTVAADAPSAEPLDDAVPGLPAARCFERTEGYESGTTPVTWQWSSWHFKCVAHVDRYAYTVFSQSLQDARQQAGAQYRILTA